MLSSFRAEKSPPKGPLLEDGDGGILLRDEVGSNVDQARAKVTIAVVRAEFAKFTVVSVSHRLDMVVDFDRVVVMDSGLVVENENPAC